MDYESVYLQDSIEILELVSLHYFQYHKDFAFPGEAHPFWEFVCVDCGREGASPEKGRNTLS